MTTTNGAGRGFRTAVLAIVAAGSVGFAVGDALATPHPNAATITSTTNDEGSRSRHESRAFEWSWRLERGQTIEIRGINGAIHAEPASGDQVEVSAIKRWRKSDPEQVRFEVNQTSVGVTVCAIYPSGRSDEPNTCEPRDHGYSRVEDNDVSVEWTVRVPRGINLIAHTVNGGLHLGSLDGKVNATTVNGSIQLATRASATATTVNGSIDAVIGRRRWDEPLEFKTVNGQIKLELPADVDADVHARTMNGSIATDFPLTAHGDPGRRMDGRLGEGGSGLHLATVNGSIRLLQAR